MDKGNTTYAATFSSGAYIEVKSSNRFILISLFLVSLPSYYINTANGLMGSDTEDNLGPNVSFTCECCGDG